MMNAKKDAYYFILFCHMIFIFCQCLHLFASCWSVRWLGASGFVFAFARQQIEKVSRRSFSESEQSERTQLEQQWHTYPPTNV